MFRLHMLSHALPPECCQSAVFYALDDLKLVPPTKTQIFRMENIFNDCLKT